MKPLCQTRYTKKTQIQFDVTIESCTVHKLSEKSYFKSYLSILSINYKKPFKKSSVESV